MTLRLFDSFDYYPTGVNIDSALWADGWFGIGDCLRAYSDKVAFGSGRQMGFSGTSVFGNSQSRYVGGRYTTTCYIGQRLWFANNFENFRFGIYDSQSVGHERQFYLEFDYLGTIRVYSGTGTLLGLSAAGRFFNSRNFYLELKFTIGTPGMVEVRVNTVPVLSYPSLNTAQGTPFGGLSPGFDGVFYETDIGGGLSMDHRWDDFYLCDSAGTINNNYLGNVRVQAQLTTGNSTPLNFAIGGSSPAATNWQSVQNNLLDDSKYVYSGNATDHDLYTVQSIINAPAIHGVMVKGAYRQDDATQRVIRNTLKSGSTNSSGADKYINQDYTFYWDIWELNPATGVGFTGTEVNGLLIGPLIQV